MVHRILFVLIKSLFLVQLAHCAGDRIGLLSRALQAASASGWLVAEEHAAEGGLALPLEPKSVRFAVIGDSGTGDKKQYEVGREMARYHEKFSFDFVIMLGDNIYGGKSATDFKRKFEDPYRSLLDDGVKFYASLGNHDDPNERFYKPFNMGGKRYYSFRNGHVQFFALDSNYMDPEQLDWLRKELQNSSALWKICYFHHPLYSEGKFHGPDRDLRKLLEPIFEKNAVNVVFSGHEHLYERIKPRNGTYYFILGSSGELRSHNLKQSPTTVQGFDTDRTFMLVEIAGDQLYFQTVSRMGKTVDSGVFQRRTEYACSEARQPHIPFPEDLAGSRSGVCARSEPLSSRRHADAGEALLRAVQRTPDCHSRRGDILPLQYPDLSASSLHAQDKHENQTEQDDRGGRERQDRNVQKKCCEAPENQKAEKNSQSGR